MVSIPKSCDILVVGSGNAALTAALSAHESGAKVLVIEKAPKSHRGGNSRFTGGIYRFVHDGMKDIQMLVPDLSEEEIRDVGIRPYTKDQYYNDLMTVTEGLADPELSEILVNESLPTVRWVAGFGFKWALMGRAGGAEGVRMSMLLGGGATPINTAEGGDGLVRMLFEIVEAKGVDVLYETKATKLIMDSRARVTGVVVRTPEGFAEIQSKAVILACGSFEANPEMRAKYMGPLWNMVKVRGTRYNTGEMLREALAIGAQPIGHWSGQHASAILARAADVEDGLRTVAYSYEYGITVNTVGKRFMDEGENVPWLTYAKMGRQILAQPGGLAFQIFDAKVNNLIFGTYNASSPAVSDTLDGLAEQLDVDAEVLKAEVKRFNDAATDVPFNRSVLDGKATRGIAPPKTNWAQPIDTPPFKAYAATCGITFAFGGVKTNRFSQVLDTEGNVIPGLYAVGEMQGGVFYHNYPGASGLMKGAVFGKIAGAHGAGE